MSGREPSQVPSRWPYVFAGVIGIVGIAGGVVVLVTQVIGNLPDIRVVVPGTHEIQLDEAGGYTIFYEHRSVVDGRLYATGDNLSGMFVTVAPKEGNSRVELSKASTNTSYSIGGRAGVSMLELKVEEPVTYIMTGEYRDGVNGPDVVLAAGKFNLFKALGIGMGSFWGGISIAAIIAVRALIKRRSARNWNRAAEALEEDKYGIASQVFLAVVTFGIYIYYWFYVTSKKMLDYKRLSGSPGLWIFIMFVPFGALYSYWKLREAVESLTDGRYSHVLIFVPWIFFSPAVWAITQSELNKMAATSSGR